MPAFVIRFHEPADASGATKEKEDVYSISYDHFYEHYAISTTFSNSHLKPISLNTLREVKQFLHALYKYVNLDMSVKTGNYIAYAQVDAGMFPSITVPRRDLLDDDVLQTLDQALDVWATISVPGIEIYKTLTQQFPSQSVKEQCEAKTPKQWTCCQPGTCDYKQFNHFFI